jgi:hypothetical protein
MPSTLIFPDQACHGLFPGVTYIPVSRATLEIQAKMHFLVFFTSLALASLTPASDICRNKGSTHQIPQPMQFFDEGVSSTLQLHLILKFMDHTYI